MSLPAPPRSPAFRVTFFYGPEPLESDPTVSFCVFNVKKRSWKAGVQIGIHVSEEQLTRVRQFVQFEDWLNQLVVEVPDSDRSDFLSRAHDLFVQHICHAKLQLALDRGIRQESCSISSETFVADLDNTFAHNTDHLKKQILQELGIEIA